MKSHLALLFAIFGVISFAYGGEAGKDKQIPEGLAQLGGALIAKTVAWGLIDRLQSGRFRLRNLREPEPREPITIKLPLPPLPDPLLLLPIELPLHIDLPDTYVDGYIALCTPGIYGLSALEDDLVVGYDLPAKTAVVDMTLSIPTNVSANSNYLTNLFMNLTGEPEVTFSGDGPSVLGFSDFRFFLKLEATVPITSGEKMGLPSLDFDFSFQDVLFHIGNLTVNGEDVSLDHLGGLIESLINLVWVPNRVAIVEMARCSIDYAINDCVPLDLVGGVLDCLKVVLNPECFGPNGAALVAAMESIKPTPNEELRGYCNPTSDETTTQTPPTTVPVDPTAPTTTADPTAPTTTADPTAPTTSADPTSSTTTTTTTTTTERTGGGVSSSHQIYYLLTVASLSIALTLS